MLLKQLKKMLPTDFHIKINYLKTIQQTRTKNVTDYCSKRNDLVLTKADKGGATVILDEKGYIAKAKEQL